MEPRRNSMRRAHRNYSEFRNSAYAGTEDPPPDYPRSGPNNITPGVPSLNQSAGSSQDSSGYGPMVESASTRLGDERIPRSFFGPSTRYYDNNVHHPHFRSFSQVIQRSIHDYEQPISRSGNYDTIRDTPASIKREKKCGSCRKVAKWIVIATIFVGIPFLVAVMSSQNLFFENPGISDLRESMRANQKAYGYMNASLIDLQNQTQSISDLRKSMQRMGMNQLQQNETIQKVLNTRNQDVEAYKYMNASLIDLQNQTQSLLPRVISSVKRYVDDLRKKLITYIQLRYPGCCGNRVITVGDCVGNCINVDDGDYQSCKTCHGFVTCANQDSYDMNCSDSSLFWDDNLRICTWESDTCWW